MLRSYSRTKGLAERTKEESIQVFVSSDWCLPQQPSSCISFNQYCLNTLINRTMNCLLVNFFVIDWIDDWSWVFSEIGWRDSQQVVELHPRKTWKRFRDCFYRLLGIVFLRRGILLLLFNLKLALRFSSFLILSLVTRFGLVVISIFESEFVVD